MIRNHTITIYIGVGGPDIEIQAGIDFTMIPGNPATGPSWDSGGQPADPAEIEIRTIELVVPNYNAFAKNGVRQTITAPCPDWLAGMIRESEEVFGALGESCDWGNDGPDPDALLEARRDHEIMGFNND